MHLNEARFLIPTARSHDKDTSSKFELFLPEFRRIQLENKINPKHLCVSFIFRPYPFKLIPLEL